MMQTFKAKQILMLTAAAAATLWLGSAGALAQTGKDFTQLMIKSYDLLEAGKTDEAQKLYEEALNQDPGNPLALNNLGAIMVKKGKYKEALAYLQQALPKARGYKVKINRVCEVDGVCLAFRPLQAEYGDRDLEPLVRLNIQLVKGKMAGEKN
ncbi:MAG: tetratricopeptide repeat protein [Deltaproteobacteria bacterium]|nr:MAG: tetratricopeptide repeat protein [Deltaproteobacteria bacterium]